MCAVQSPECPICGVQPLLSTFNDLPYYTEDNPLLCAIVWIGHIECLEKYKQKYGDLSAEFNITINYNRRDRIYDEYTYKGTVLKLAAFTGNGEVVKFLLQEGLDVNDKYLDHDTPLMVALKADKADCVKYLIEAGADIGKRKVRSRHVVPLVQSPECFVELKNAGYVMNCTDVHGVPLFMYAIRFRCVDLVRFLLESGVDVNRDYPYFYSPLTCAAETKQLDLVKMLLSYGCAINHKPWQRSWWTAYDFALAAHAVEVVRYLLSKDCTINNLQHQFFRSWHCHHFSCAAGPPIETARLAVAAGEILPRDQAKDILGAIHGSQKDMSLQHLTREIIRSHLIYLNQERSLFTRIPKLPLPDLVKNYLLYNENLKDKPES